MKTKKSFSKVKKKKKNSTELGSNTPYCSRKNKEIG